MAKSIIYAMTLAFLLPGCATNSTSGARRGTQLYPGPERPREEVAVLRRSQKAWKLRFDMKSIDGEEVSGSDWEVLPGSHTIQFVTGRTQTMDFGYGKVTVYLRANCMGALNAAAGREYLVEADYDYDRETRNATFDGWFTDAETQGRVGRIDCIATQ